MADRDPDSTRDPSQDSKPGSEQSTRTSHTPSSEQDRIGNYRILEQVGTGGMGEVYLAEQTEPIRRTVALKVIKRGMDTKEVITRFEAERQALALMDHPGIAKVFDAGSTPEGRPYFAMEYVKGIPITAYCDKHKLTTRERLELFMQLCDGVQHAHQKAIIHRDLKPSNVLVTIQDDKPVPKIIDFGVAKATAQKLTEKTMYTAFGELIGTPTYMSPEQAEMTGEDVDTRTDVYSLGVILYELLAGALPFDPDELRNAGFEGMVRMIREKDPPRPSTKVSTLGERTTDVAAARRTVPGKLGSQLRGDLDWITMRALEKDRTRRYSSAAELATDLRRHLRHEPVLAGPPGAGYRVKKFVRRHRVGVLAGSVVAASLIAAAIVSVRFAQVAVTERDTAKTERDVAQAVNDFLNHDLLAAVAPSAEKGKGKDVLMRDVLDEAAKSIDEAAAPGGKFEDKPLVEASIRHTLGVTYVKLGKFPAAEPHVERARELRSRELGEEHPETLAAMDDLAILYASQGRYDSAEPLFVKTLEIAERALGEDHTQALNTRSNLGNLYRIQRRSDEAEPLIVKTLEIRKRVLGEEHPETLASMSNLAILYGSQGRLDAAEPLFVKALEIRKRVLGEEHPETLASMSNLAYLYKNSGRYGEAERLFLKALEIHKQVLGEEHPTTLNVLGNYGATLIELERYEDAEVALKEANETLTSALGPSHGVVIEQVESLVKLYDAWSKPEKAAEWRAKLPTEQQADASDQATRRDDKEQE